MIVKAAEKEAALIVVKNNYFWEDNINIGC